MPYRDPFLEQELVDQGEVNQLMGQPQAPMVRPPASGMNFSMGKPFRFDSAQPSQAAPVSPETQRLIDATNRVAGAEPQAPAVPRAPTDISSFLGTGTRLGNGRRDEQALAALGPEYIAAARELGNDPSARQNQITGRNETTGESFVATPGNRVSRDALRGVAERVAMDKLKQEGIQAEDRAFGQKKELAALPGQQKADLFDKASAAEMARLKQQQEYESPERQQRLKQGEQKLTQGELAIDQSKFDQSQRNDPQAKGRAAADAQYERLAAMPQTPTIRALMAQVYPQTSIGSRVSPEVAAGFSKELARNPADQGAEIDAALADSEVAPLLARATSAGSQYAKDTAGVESAADFAGKIAAPVGGFGVRGLIKKVGRAAMAPGESQLTANEDAVNRAVESVLRKNPSLNEGAVREKITQLLESVIQAPADDTTANRMRGAARKKP